MNILFSAAHTGGVNVILPLYKKSSQATILADDVAKIQFNQRNISFKHPGNEDRLHYARKAIDKYKPDIIIAGQSLTTKQNYSLDQALQQAANEKNIPSISITDLWNGRTAFFSTNKITIDSTILPTKLTAIDQANKDLLIAEGFPEDIIAITGNPYFDSLRQEKELFTQQQKKKIRQDLSIPEDAYLITFTSQPIRKFYGTNVNSPEHKLGYTEKEVLQAVSAVQEAIGATVLYKAHPAQKQADIKADFTAIGKTYPIDITYNTRQTMLASDLVIAAMSTTIAEAAIMGIPALSIQPNLGQRKDPLYTNTIGVTTGVRTIPDAITAAKQIKAGLLKQATYTPIPDATGNVIKLAETLTNTSFL